MFLSQKAGKAFIRIVEWMLERGRKLLAAVRNSNNKGLLLARTWPYDACHHTGRAAIFITPKRRTSHLQKEDVIKGDGGGVVRHGTRIKIIPTLYNTHMMLYSPNWLDWMTFVSQMGLIDQPLEGCPAVSR